MLSDRKKKILKLVIDDYFNSASPVSSKAIHDTYLEDVSPATIRNELAALEDMGLLVQPHTSAGRIPTNLAYKLYVDSIVNDTRVSEQELLSMKRYFNSTVKEAEYIAQNAVKVLTDMTNYTSMGSLGEDFEKIQGVKLVKLSDNAIVLIVITETGKVSDFKVYGNFIEGDDYLKTAESILQDKILGKSFCQLEDVADLMYEEFHQFRGFFNKIFDAFKNGVKERNNLYLMGESKIFEHKEYNDINTVKDFMGVIDGKDKLQQLMKDNAGDDGEVKVILGGEANGLPKDCSMVTANFHINDIDFGTFGVIGPTRMDYNKVIKVLNGIRAILIDMAGDKE